MSADNYLVIRKDGSRYAVEDRSESDTYRRDEPIPDNAPRFDTLKDAEAYAYAQHAEYGVVYEFDPFEVGG